MGDDGHFVGRGKYQQAVLPRIDDQAEFEFSRAAAMTALPGPGGPPSDRPG